MKKVLFPAGMGGVFLLLAFANQGCTTSPALQEEDVFAGTAGLLDGADPIATFDGVWFSGDFLYAFEITDRIGVMTLSNSDFSRVGDVILVITFVDENRFDANHLFSDGGVHRIIGSLVDPDTLLLAGGGFTWTMTRLDTNQPPIAEDQVIQGPFEQPIEIILTGTDPDDSPSPLAFSLESLPASGRLSGEPPRLTYTPNPGFSGNDVFAFSTSDGADGSPTATIFISVEPSPNPNQPPVVDAGRIVSVTLPVDFVELDGTITDDQTPSESLITVWTVLSGPGNVIFANAGVVDTSATVVQAGVYVLQLEASDGELTASDTVTLFVHAPILAP